jgi:hypothetical protein
MAVGFFAFRTLLYYLLDHSPTPDEARRVVFWAIVNLIVLFVFYIARVTTSSSPALTTSVIALGMTITVITFALFVYPLISVRWGGGAPIKVQFTVDSKQVDIINELLQVAPTARTPVVELLDQTDKMYIVLIDGKTCPQKCAVEIDKSLIKGVIYIP